MNKFCIFISPSEDCFRYPSNLARLSLSLGVGVITGYLEEQGINVHIEDLNVTIADRINRECNKEEFSDIYRYEVIKEYMQSDDEKPLDLLFDKLIDCQLLNEFDYYGISIGANFSFLEINMGFLLGKYLKKKTQKRVIIGGNNVSFLYIFSNVFYDFWRLVLEEFKFIIKGPGEKIIYDIIQGINNDENSEYFEKLDGIVSIENSKVISNHERSPEIILPSWANLDMKYYCRYMIDGGNNDKTLKDNLNHFYKWPDTIEGSPGQIVNIYNRFIADNTEGKVIIPYIFNYNCPYNCAFCTQSDYDRGKVIGGECEKVITDILALKEKYNTNFFYFLNNAFNYSNNFVINFCTKLIEQNIKIYWSDCGRFNNLTYEVLELMKKAGCTKLTFGFETGSEKMINFIDKQIDLNQAEKVLEWCYELGIWADVEVIIGLPQETEQDFQATYKFIEKNRKYINYFWVNEYFVVPNSLIGKYPERYGVKLLEDYTNYETLLKDNLKYFNKEFRGIMPANAKLYGYDEVSEKGGRKYKEILEANRDKIKRINSLQNKEFFEAATFYKILLAMKGK